MQKYAMIRVSFYISYVELLNSSRQYFVAGTTILTTTVFSLLYFRITEHEFSLVFLLDISSIYWCKNRYIDCIILCNAGTSYATRYLPSSGKLRFHA